VEFYEVLVSFHEDFEHFMHVDDHPMCMGRTWFLNCFVECTGFEAHCSEQLFSNSFKLTLLPISICVGAQQNI